MSRQLMRAITLCVAASMACSAVSNETAAASQKESPATAVQRLDAATTLAAWALEQGDAMAIVAAARAMLAVGDASVRNAADPMAPNALLSQAARLAKGDAAVAAMIAETLASSPKGPIVGVGRQDLILAPGESITLDYVYVAREIADVGVRLMRPTPGVDIDIHVVDAEGREVAADRGSSTGIWGRSAYVAWKPEACESFTVEVRNLGQAAAEIVVATAPARNRQCETPQ